MLSCALLHWNTSVIEDKKYVKCFSKHSVGGNSEEPKDRAKVLPPHLQLWLIHPQQLRTHSDNISRWHFK